MFHKFCIDRLHHLDSPPPDGLHGQGDEAGDGVRQGQVVHEVMDIGADPGIIKLIHCS